MQAKSSNNLALFVILVNTTISSSQMASAKDTFKSTLTLALTTTTKIFNIYNKIEAHGGKIRAENNDAFDRKKGATVTFSIPLSELEQYQNQT